jgi:hypothetical protein
MILFRLNKNHNYLIVRIQIQEANICGYIMPTEWRSTSGQFYFHSSNDVLVHRIKSPELKMRNEDILERHISGKQLQTI